MPWLIWINVYKCIAKYKIGIHLYLTETGSNRDTYPICRREQQWLSFLFRIHELIDWSSIFSLAYRTSVSIDGGPHTLNKTMIEIIALILFIKLHNYNEMNTWKNKWYQLHNYDYWLLGTIVMKDTELYLVLTKQRESKVE